MCPLLLDCSSICCSLYTHIPCPFGFATQEHELNFALVCDEAMALGELEKGRRRKKASDKHKDFGILHGIEGGL